MADNYLENKYQALQERKAKEQKARQAAWKKRMDAYRKKLQEQAEDRPEQTINRAGHSVASPILFYGNSVFRPIRA